MNSGVRPPVECFDAVGRRQNERPLDWTNLHGLMRCFTLKANRLPAVHACYPHKFLPTILTKLMGPEPNVTAIASFCKSAR